MVKYKKKLRKLNNNLSIYFEVIYMIYINGDILRCIAYKTKTKPPKKYKGEVYNNLLILEDFIDFSSATYTFYIDKNEMIIDCTIGLSEFEMEDNRIEVPYGETGYFKFYQRDTSVGSDIVVTLNDIDTITIPASQVPIYSRPGTPRVIPGVCSNYVLSVMSGYYELRIDNQISDVNIKIRYDN